MIDQLTIDKVIDTAQIFDVVSEFVTLKRRGQNYIGLCPFHNDRTPSFYVSPSKNICKCFSCGKGGNAVRFLMEHEQMSFLEAIKWLAAKYNIEIEERRLTDEEQAAQTEREGMLMLNEFAQQTFSSQLYDTDEGRNIGLSYFYERGFRDELIKKFKLGYTLDARSGFAETALRKGFGKETLLKTGLCYERDNDGRLVDRFRARVMFPIHSLSGKVVAFGGRVLDARTKGVNQKYVNSPESEVYHKSNVLYGIYQAKQAISKAQCCYLVEGYTDVLSMHQAGIENVIASSGTALTQGQIRIIQRFTPNITVLYDGDSAGIHAALRGIDMILKEGMSVKVLLLPDEEDPDSFARKHTSAEFLDYIAAHETDFLRFKTSLLMKEAADDPIKRANMIADIVRTIAIIPDPIVTSVYIRETSRMLEVSEEILTNAVNLQKTNNYQAERKQEEIARRRAQNQLRTVRQSQPETAEADKERAGEEAEVPAVVPEVDQTIRTMVFSSDNGHDDAVSERKSLLTDRFERNIIRYLVRDGGKSFQLTGADEAGNPVAETWRVVDFIGNEIFSEGIAFRHPLYAKMFQLAIDNSADTRVPFDSIRFFSAHPDPEISMLATDMLADKYATYGISEADANLSVLVPRALLELKEAIVRDEIMQLKEQLKQPQADIREIMTRIAEKNEVRKLLEKDLGERIVTW